ncbi:unnamed protein product [Prorocentrum cordatum]|uniref:Uncharacterized protein n=1 Tax=Prorocentrum cordatum TaxID=2364126 RepID=A0ABN9UJA2_9DINO|nr:unnamed protein product [Polarella glacialis]
MSDAPALRLRLGAIGAVLRAVHGADRHRALSRVQSNAVVAMLHRAWANIPREDQAALSLMIISVDWYQGHDGPMTAILGRDSSAALKRARQAQQKYTGFVEFLTEDKWSKLMPDDGGVNACEHATKQMASMWLLMCDPNAHKMNGFQLKANHGYVKKEYRNIAGKSPRPDTYMATLPSLPTDLARSYPRAYAKARCARAGDGPARCPLDMAKLRGIGNAHRCRGMGAEKHAAQPMGGGPQGPGNAASGQLVPFAPSGGPQDDIGHILAQQAQQMQRAQTMATTAMPLVAGGRVGAGAGSAGDGIAQFMDASEVFGGAARPGRRGTNAAPGPPAAAPAAADPAAASPAAAPAAAAAAPAAAAPADCAGAVALAAPANAPQTLAQNLKRTVGQAMGTMQAKREEAKAKSKAKRAMKKPAAKPAKAKKDDEEDGGAKKTPTPGARTTKEVTLAHGKRGAGDTAAKLGPPKTRADRATKATPPKTKANKATPPKTKADEKLIDISDLAVLTKKTLNATARERFASKAYHAARQRAKAAGKPTGEMKELGRMAHAASAASWDKLKGG